MSSIQVGVRVPPHLHKELENHAAKMEASKSEIIINALARYLECTEDIPLNQRVAALEAQVKNLSTLMK
ncbi:MAG: ribbon-helix-helix protein, CopG family [Cyanobacteria bacterium P01_H01_bin.105]